MLLNTDSGLLTGARYVPSPNCDERQDHAEPEVIILHCISLPPGNYSGDAISQFFCNSLDCDAHPYFQEIADLTVSAHFLIQRDGNLIQYVPTTMRAWHAGESVCLGKPKVNDFSLGIELQGLDTDPQGFTDHQYQALNPLIAALREAYPRITAENLFAHSDISPGRKPDPGPYFDWSRAFELP